MSMLRLTPTILALVLLGGCNGGPSDGALKKQITQHFDSQTWGSSACRDHFSVEGVRVNDKQVEGSLAAVNLTVSVKAKHAVNGMDGIAMCYGAQSWGDGEVKSFPMTVRLQRWDSGWKIVSM
jgi:hypothetical protein